jgi:hypothetical protein
MHGAKVKIETVKRCILLDVYCNIFGSLLLCKILGFLGCSYLHKSKDKVHPRKT